MFWARSGEINSLLIGNTYETALWWVVLTRSLTVSAICLLGIWAGASATKWTVRWSLLLPGVLGFSLFHLYGFLYFGTGEPYLFQEPWDRPLWGAFMFTEDSFCAVLTVCVIAALLRFAQYRGLSLSRQDDRPGSIVRAMLIVVSSYAVVFALLKGIQPYPRWFVEFFPNWLAHALLRHTQKLEYRGLVIESLMVTVTALAGIWATLTPRIRIWKIVGFAILCVAVMNAEIILYRFVIYKELSYSYLQQYSLIGLWIAIEMLAVLLFVRWRGYRATWSESNQNASS